VERSLLLGLLGPVKGSRSYDMAKETGSRDEASTSNVPSIGRVHRWAKVLCALGLRHLSDGGSGI
jgi:hypothetical protein